MSEVRIKIGDRSYDVACQDGQEAHIAKLGQMIAEKYESLGDARAPLEAQNLLFSALFLADELDELRSKKPTDNRPSENQESEAELRAEIESLKQSKAELVAQREAVVRELAELRRNQANGQSDEIANPEFASQLEELASRVEAAADALEAQ